MTRKLAYTKPSKKSMAYLGAFDAASCEFFLVTPGTVDILFARDERLGADRRLAHEAAEALLVPLSTLVFHFFGSCAPAIPERDIHVNKHDISKQKMWLNRNTHAANRALNDKKNIKIKK